MRASKGYSKTSIVISISQTAGSLFRAVPGLSHLLLCILLLFNRFPCCCWRPL
jgi:hypothetical protein